MRIASRVLSTTSPPLTSLMDRAARLRAQGRPLFQLGQAMVDYEPPYRFIQALTDGCESRQPYLHGYAPDAGTPELREALGRYMARSFGIEADAEREILVTPGANHGAYTALSVLLEPDDEAVLISPYYFNHLMTVTLLGARARFVDDAAERRFLPRAEDIVSAWTPKTRVLALVNPCNPTGARYPDDWLRELAVALGRDERWRDVWILSDQTYQEIYFTTERPLSPASLPELRGKTITLGHIVSYLREWQASK